MSAFILLWNPTRWNWPDEALAEAIATTAKGEPVPGRWSTGSRHQGIEIGDRAYLIRQGSAGRGLAAVGRFTSPIYWDEHWDGSGNEAPYADVEWERIVEAADVLPLDVLARAAPGVAWGSLRGGGVAVRPEVEARVERLWADHVGETRPSRRNPDWAWDEIVLALDLYFRVGVQSSSHPEVIELSEVLNRLPIHTDRPQADRFRNPNGVNLKLANLAYLDPDYPGVGMKGGGRLEREVFQAYADRRSELEAVAGEIREMATKGTAPVLPEVDESEVGAIEGRLLYRRHRERERDLKVVAKKKRAVLKATGRLACEACGIDFGERYGERGDGFIECHHTRPLSESGETVTRLGDLALLCSNCHRMVHVRPPTLTVDEVRNALSGAG